MRVAGPVEDYDGRWRTTTSHSTKQMMSVYNELFFAGFPCPTETRSKQLIVFPEALVKEFFARFGTVTHFYFDVTKGVGAVSFENGEDAERCYLTAHLSLMQSGGQHQSRHDDHSSSSSSQLLALTNSCDSATAILSQVFGPQSALLYLEFAQFLPFVNPLLLDRSLTPMSMNRQLLRTFPVCERRSSSNTAMCVVYSCSKGPIEEHAADITLPGSGNTKDLSETLALVRTLFPVGAGDTAHSVTVLDLWSEYYRQFVVTKTQPDKERIANPRHGFAAKASSLQDVLRYCKSLCEEGSDRSRGELMRFVEDDVLHSAMAYICFKTRMINDPSLVSLLRAVESRNQKQQQGRKNIESPAAATPASTIADAVSSISDEVSASEKLIKLSLVTAATNAIENAVNFYGIPKNTKRGDVDEVRFQNVLKLFDAYAASGSAASIVQLCCDPESFGSKSGLMGTVPTVKGMLWRTLKLPLMAMALLFLFLWLMIRFNEASR